MLQVTGHPTAGRASQLVRSFQSWCFGRCTSTNAAVFGLKVIACVKLLRMVARVKVLKSTYHKQLTITYLEIQVEGFKLNTQGVLSDYIWQSPNDKSARRLTKTISQLGTATGSAISETP